MEGIWKSYIYAIRLFEELVLDRIVYIIDI